MVENRPWLNFFTHLILILGVVVVVFPVYVAFVASTQTAVEVEQAPMSLLPGAHFIENYAQVLFEGETAVAQKGLGIEDVPEGVWMPGVLSRKKQVAAPILAAAE